LARRTPAVARGRLGIGGGLEAGLRVRLSGLVFGRWKMADVETVLAKREAELIELINELGGTDEDIEELAFIQFSLLGEAVRAQSKRVR
jgi:hypothetical protein